MKEKCSRVRQGTPVKFSHDRIKRLVDEIVGYETEIDKKKEEIVELLH